MKWASFEAAGVASYGIVRADAVLDIGSAVGSRLPTLRAAIEADELEALASMAAPLVPLSGVCWLPPVPDARKIICIGLNYRAHAVEVGMELPSYPSMFARFNNSFVGSGTPVVRPKLSDRFDFEGELAVVIGKHARHVSAADALSIVAGYTCLGDYSVRDFQAHSPTGMSGKNFWHSGAVGPWMVTAADVPDPARLHLTTTLNGTEVQRSPVSDMIFSVPELIEYITRCIALEPGDIVATGTPAGVGWGRQPPLWMKAGDRIAVTIDGVGKLENLIVDEA